MCTYPIYVPSNYKLVYFTLENGEKRFLPTYGRYGYLDLLDRLVDEWKPNNEIKYPFCGNHNVLIMQRSPRSIGTIEWLEIDIDSFNENI